MDTPQDHSTNIETRLGMLTVKLDALDRLINERFKLSDEALRLQAVEYGRRLEILNHEQARLQLDRERYLPREVYEAQLKAIDTRIATMHDQLISYTARERGIIITVNAIIVLISLGVGTVGILLTSR